MHGVVIKCEWSGPEPFSFLSFFRSIFCDTYAVTEVFIVEKRARGSVVLLIFQAVCVCHMLHWAALSKERP